MMLFMTVVLAVVAVGLNMYTLANGGIRAIGAVLKGLSTLFNVKKVFLLWRKSYREAWSAEIAYNLSRCFFILTKFAVDIGILIAIMAISDSPSITGFMISAVASACGSLLIMLDERGTINLKGWITRQWNKGWKLEE